MKELDENGYKYLGVSEGDDIMNREMKKKVKEGVLEEGETGGEVEMLK